RQRQNEGNESSWRLAPGYWNGNRPGNHRNALSRTFGVRQINVPACPLHHLRRLAKPARGRDVRADVTSLEERVARIIRYGCFGRVDSLDFEKRLAVVADNRSLPKTMNQHQILKIFDNRLARRRLIGIGKESSEFFAPGGK